MKNLDQAVKLADLLQQADGGSYGVVYTTAYVGQGPYFVVEAEQVPILVKEGCRLMYRAERERVVA